MPVSCSISCLVCSALKCPNNWKMNKNQKIRWRLLLMPINLYRYFTAKEHPKIWIKHQTSKSDTFWNHIVTVNIYQQVKSMGHNFMLYHVLLSCTISLKFLCLLLEHLLTSLLSLYPKPSNLEWVFLNHGLLIPNLPFVTYLSRKPNSSKLTSTMK